MAGSATGRAVSSMKAMLDPSIVAAKTHGAAFGAQADSTFCERITPSSQGCLVTLAIGLPVLCKGALPLCKHFSFSALQHFSPVFLWLTGIAIRPALWAGLLGGVSHRVWM